jgi:hypothetical protein
MSRSVGITGMPSVRAISLLGKVRDRKKDLRNFLTRIDQPGAQHTRPMIMFGFLTRTEARKDGIRTMETTCLLKCRYHPVMTSLALAHGTPDINISPALR